MCDFAPGFYEVLFIPATDTTDKERDGFICSVSELPVPSEDLQAWKEDLDAALVPQFNVCAVNSGNRADSSFWQCVTEAGMAMPELSREMVKRLLKG